ncbi:MFS transporter [Bacillus manliponensis]|uniref:MFS transporter n=1 Tax=Bacillus manliponensis TaxID=574376 RepID=UPI0035132456
MTKTKFLLLFGNGISRLGDFMYLVALNWMVLEETGSGAAVAGLWLIGPIAAFCTNFWAGSIVDRSNKRAIIIMMNVIRALLVFCIPLFSSIWPIYACIFLIHIANSFSGSASFAYTTTIIPREERQQFNAWNSLATSGSFVTGPAIAGILMALYSPQFVIFCNGASFLIAAIVMYFLPNLSSQEKDTKADELSLFQKLHEDWREVFSFARSATYIVLIYALFQMTMLIATALDSQEVVFSKQVLQLSETQYSMLVTLTGAGYVLGSFLASLLAKKLPLQYGISVGMVVTGIGYVIYAFSQSFIVAVSAFIILGLFSAVANTSFLTFYQNSIPLHMIGRIASVFDGIRYILQAIFVVIIGVLAEILSVQIAVIGSALLILLCSCILAVSVMRPARGKYYITKQSSADVS